MRRLLILTTFENVFQLVIVILRIRLLTATSVVMDLVIGTQSFISATWAFGSSGRQFVSANKTTGGQAKHLCVSVSVFYFIYL